MRDKSQMNELLKFTILVLFLLVISLVGILAPESASQLQSSNFIRWSAAILCGLFLSYFLSWIASAAPDATNPITQGAQINWQVMQSKGKGQYIREIMMTDMKRVLYLHPLMMIFVGWILGWSVNKIVGVVSIINLANICGSFFHALKLWELVEKKHTASMSDGAE
jgi:hypothetical protein